MTVPHISDAGKYRYLLRRLWPTRGLYRAGKGPIMFIGLNPSTADDQQDDPTIRRCINFAKGWGYSELIMTNLFAFRSTLPSGLKSTFDPVGPGNQEALEWAASRSSLILACWGNHGSYLSRDRIIRRRFPNLHILGITKRGQPVHPLYQPACSQPMPWNEVEKFITRR